jgi:hypothetical protein
MSDKRHFLSQIPDDANTKNIEIMRCGTFTDPRYGEFKITKEMLLSMVDNFQKNTVGQMIMLDVAHNPSDGSAGIFRDISTDGEKLYGMVELSEFGKKAISEKKMIYISAEYDENFQNNEGGSPVGATLLGAALTTRPVIKNLQPIKLSLDNLSIPILCSNDFLKELAMSADTKTPKEEEEKELSMTEEEKAAFAEKMAAARAKKEEKPEKELAEPSNALTPAAVQAMIDAAMKAAKDNETKKGLSEKQNKAKFLAEIDAAQGLDDETKTHLKKLSEGLITFEMTESQVKMLAQSQLQMANRFIADAKLKSLGFDRQGSIGRIEVDESNKIKQLQESFDKHLPTQFEDAKLGKLVKDALDSFDIRNEQRLLSEANHYAQVKRLAGGSNNIGDFVFPAIVERSVLRQALFNLTATQFVNVGTAPLSTTYDYHYAERDITAAGPNQTRVYENQPISSAGLGMRKVSAYPIPQKLAMNLSIESMLLFQNIALNFDAYAELISEMSRIIQEDTDIALFNEQIHSADEYGAIPITDEVLTSQLNGTKTIFVLSHFPVVFPRKIFSLDGVQIGSTTNPIVVTYAGNVIQEYKPNQPAGIYYKLDYNVGEMSVCNEAGAIITPANATTLKVSYSYATNCVAWDMDVPSGVDMDVHYDGLLRVIGQRKAQLVAHPRFAKPDFILVSETIMNAASEAKSFIAAFSKPGTELTNKGSLGKIKAIPVYSTNNPYSMLTDQRILMGETGQTRFRMLQPWQMQGLQDKYDSNGKPVGAKQAYGVQYIGIDTPPSLKNRLSSVVLYSSSARIAR